MGEQRGSNDCANPRATAGSASPALHSPLNISLELYATPILPCRAECCKHLHRSSQSPRNFGCAKKSAAPNPSSGFKDAKSPRREAGWERDRFLRSVLIRDVTGRRAHGSDCKPLFPITRHPLEELHFLIIICNYTSLLPTKLLEAPHRELANRGALGTRLQHLR